MRNRAISGSRPSSASPRSLWRSVEIDGQRDGSVPSPNLRTRSLWSMSASSAWAAVVRCGGRAAPSATTLRRSRKASEPVRAGCEVLGRDRTCSRNARMKRSPCSRADPARGGLRAVGSFPPSVPNHARVLADVSPWFALSSPVWGSARPPSSSPVTISAVTAAAASLKAAAAASSSLIRSCTELHGALHWCPAMVGGPRLLTASLSAATGPDEVLPVSHKSAGKSGAGRCLITCSSELDVDVPVGAVSSRAGRTRCVFGLGAGLCDAVSPPKRDFAPTRPPSFILLGSCTTLPSACRAGRAWRVPPSRHMASLRCCRRAAARTASWWTLRHE
mmetsp:Transcript_14235/g.41770  ORF Transcript_14235/g.41770 Transcript_14235/m.41770 type:complete len:333 (+) Transcript_14235:492-1490(+)